MSESQAEFAFHFVDWSEISGPNKDPATRVLIRKQAMSKAAAARKKRGNWGKRKAGQTVLVSNVCPGGTKKNVKNAGVIETGPGPLTPPGSRSGSDESDMDLASINERPDSGNALAAQKTSLIYTSSVPASMTSTGYEKLRMQYNFDLLDLSAMTTFHVGRITAQGLSNAPLRLIDVLQCRQWSYFSYLPSRYGYFSCLDDAARCVASRVRHWLEGDISISSTVLLLYAKALESLQAALNDPELYLKPEVLCATEILSIYELLDNTRQQGWEQHAAGAKSLLKLRGASRYQSSFEKALFMAQIGPIYTEALIENHGCFLENSDWQSVLQSIAHSHPITESPSSDRGIIVVSLWSHLCSLPTLYRDVQDAICTPNNFPSTIEVFDLQNRVIRLDTSLSAWRSRYAPVLLTPSLSPSADKADKNYETLGVCLAGLLVLKRLAIALAPLASSASATESEAQNLSYEIFDIEKKAAAANPRAALFMRFKMEVARATVLTGENWQVGSRVDERVGANGLIAPWVYERWCRLKGRKV